MQLSHHFELDLREMREHADKLRKIIANASRDVSRCTRETLTRRGVVPEYWSRSHAARVFAKSSKLEEQPFREEDTLNLSFFAVSIVKYP
jgi:hypothetical protein